MNYYISHLGIISLLLVITGCSTSTMQQQNTNIPQTPDKQIVQDVEVIEEIPKQDTITEQDESEEASCNIFNDFTSWGVVNDGVMGGKSQGSIKSDSERLVFSGNIVTRGGGFSSIRSGLEAGVLSDTSGVTITAKSDGRQYRITFRDSRWRNISHRAIIPFQNPGELETIFIPYTDLQPAYFGRNIQADPFEKESAREIGIILSDGVDGAFELEVERIEFCKKII